MTAGERIRHYRKIRKLTQKELAEKVGLSEPAIRLYELGKREPSEKQIEAISEALDITPQSLTNIRIASVREALELLFRLEDELGLYPNGDLAYSVDPKNPNAKKIAAANKAWISTREDLERGRITREDYDLWKAEFGS